MTTQAQMAKIIPPDTLAQHRLDGMSYRTIARLHHVSTDRLREYAHATLPPHLLDLRTARLARIAELIPKTLLIKLRLAGTSFRQIAQDYDVSRNQLQEYARQVLPPRFFRSQPYANERTERIQAGIYPCTRCDFFPDNRNPLLDDGKCLYCHVEDNGMDLLSYHESGMAKEALDHLRDST